MTLTLTLTRWGIFAPFWVSVRIEDGKVPGLSKPTQTANYQPPVLIAEQKGGGAGDGNRTHLAGLGSRCITTMLHPRRGAFILAVSPFKSSQSW